MVVPEETGPLHSGGNLYTDIVEDSWCNVQSPDYLPGCGSSGLPLRIFDDQWKVNLFIVESCPVPPAPVFKKLFSMVGGKNNQGVFVKPFFFLRNR